MRADPDFMTASITHEFYHRATFILNGDAAPYPYEGYGNTEQEVAFEKVMHDTLANLHTRFIPHTQPPLNIEELAKNLKTISSDLLPVERSIISTVSSIFKYYDKYQFHAEFVVKLPEIIAQFGELPPYIREDFFPLENYYKTKLTPRHLEYIENHPRKDILLPTDYDRYYPETILSRSGEDELMAKDPQKLNQQERALLEQMQQMQEFIRSGNSISANNMLPKLQDERVIRASLTASIEHDNVELFSKLFKLIKAPQYLGPQLILAANLKRSYMAKELTPQIINQYYLSKSIKIAYDNFHAYLFMDALKGIKNKWFLERLESKEASSTFSSYLRAVYEKLPSSDPPSFIPQDIRRSLFDIPVNYLKAALSTTSSISSSEIDTLPLSFINLDKSKQQKALHIAKIPEFKEFIDSEKYSKKDIILSVFVKFSDADRNKAFDLLKIPEFKEFIDSDKFFKIEILSAFVKFSDIDRNKAFALLKTPEFKEFIDSGFSQASLLPVLVKFSDIDCNKAFDLIKIPKFKEAISSLANKAIALPALVKFSDIDRNKALDLLKIPEFRRFVDFNRDKESRLPALVALSEGNLNKALILLKTEGLKIKTMEQLDSLLKATIKAQDISSSYFEPEKNLDKAKKASVEVVASLKTSGIIAGNNTPNPVIKENKPAQFQR